jgi:membrane-bound serine protease (ClpP class)
MKLGNLACSLGRLAVLLALVAVAQAQSARVIEIDIDRVVHPLTAEIVSQGLAQADRDNDSAVLIRLNTPGGLLSATQEIIQKIIASRVPVITYVSPSGGRAASAGFMILIAGDVAAMAPGTNTGAAHPVMMGGEMDEVMKQKVGNDAAAAVRSMAQKRGRNAEVAETAVLESKAFTEQEALNDHLIDVVADDVPSLLRQLDGRTVTRFHGEQQTLHLANAVPYPLELTWRQRTLLPLTDPSLAFMLLILGLVGIYIEFTHPGLIFPGVAGGIVVIVSLMALSLLPINWAGAALILLGLACFILEATVTSGGILATGGVVAMVFGTVLLIDTEVPELSIGWGTAIAVTLPFALITVFLLRLAVKSFRYKVATGVEAMVGEIGIAKTDLHPEGRVFVHGEWWNAQSQQPVPSGAKVRIIAVDGLLLTVTPVETKDRVQAV